MKPLLLGLVFVWFTLAAPVFAEPTLSQRVTQIDQALHANQEALVQYTWQQQEVITVGGSVKKQALYQVKPLTGALPQRTLVGRASSRLSDEDENYAEQIAGLAETYMQPQPGKLMQLLNQGNVVINPTDQLNVVAVDVQGYVKQGDDVTILFNDHTNQIFSIRVATYLTDPLSMVHIMTQYALLPEGVNHVTTLTVNGLSNKLVINESNLNYKTAQ